jgi:hypothetical protein
MALFADHHRDVEGLTAEAVAEAHKKDLEIQNEYGVKSIGTGTTRRAARCSALPKLRTKKRRRLYTVRRMVWSPRR